MDELGLGLGASGFLPRDALLFSPSFFGAPAKPFAFSCWFPKASATSRPAPTSRREPLAMKECPSSFGPALSKSNNAGPKDDGHSFNLLGFQAMDHSGKRGGFAQVVEAADPGDGALDAKTKPRVRN